MPRTIRFHLDENVPAAIASGLRRVGIDVTRAQDVGLMGALDEEQAAWALAEGRVIFTQDEDFLRIHAAGVEHAGIAHCRQRSRSIGQIVGSLSDLWERLEPEEMAGRVEFLGAIAGEGADPGPRARDGLQRDATFRPLSGRMTRSHTRE